MNLYRVFDISAPLLADIEIEAEDSKQAVMLYLKSKGLEGAQIKRSGGNFVRWCAQRVEVVDGVRYHSGRKVWYGIRPRLRR